MGKRSKKRKAASPLSARTVLLTLGIGAALLALVWLVNRLLPARVAATAPSQPQFAIAEVMTANESSCPAPDGSFCDWVEIVNAGSEPASAAGWKLCNSIDLRGAYALPETVLQPGERIVVWCAGRTGAPDMASFALSKDGASLFLLAPDGAIAETLNVPALKKGEVYARSEDDGAWQVTRAFTPGLSNTAASYEALTAVPAETGDVSITEVMASNATTLEDASGDTPDWIEIRNSGAERVNLAGWSLTTDPARLRMWVFPNVTLQAGESRVIFASGKESTGDELHASFKLSARGERVSLVNADGKIVSTLTYTAAEKDVSTSRRPDGTLTTSIPPTPGRENTAANADGIAVGENDERIYINEVVCSMQGYSDWLELYNASGADFDLSGWHLSDSAAKPQKWTFPAGTRIAAGEYKVIFLNGGHAARYQEGYICADFALSRENAETAVLARPDGTVADAVPLYNQRGGVSFGRAEGYPNYRYFAELTPGAPNAATSYARLMDEVSFSAPGGIMQTPVTLALTAQAGSEIRYTTDGTEPTAASTLYTQPLAISNTAVIRAKAFGSDAMPSCTAARTYLFGEQTALRVVCVSGDPSALDGEGGVLRTGAQTKVGINVEVYGQDGAQMLAQGCELMIIGSNTRLKRPQKAMRLTARSACGDSMFRAKLFTARTAEACKAFVLRASGQDQEKSYMRDSVLSALNADTGVFYQETELATVYVNGAYWGVYNMREHIDAYSICAFEGWTGNEDDLDILEGRDMLVEQGSKAYYTEMMDFVRSADFTDDTVIERLRTYCDLENYLDYVAFNMYVEQEDLSNIRIYRNRAGDGLWRWTVFDLDFSFNNDKNSARVWLEKEGSVDAMTQQDNTLFYRLMQNRGVRAQFLTRMGELMTTTFTAENVVGRIRARYDAIADEMVRHWQKWGREYKSWQNSVAALAEYAETRTEKLIGYFRLTFNLSDDEVNTYFGRALEMNAAYHAAK